MTDHDVLVRIRDAGTTRPVLVWGAGRAGVAAVRCLRDAGIVPVAFIDSRPHPGDARVEGLPVFAPDHVVRLRSEDALPFVVIASMYAHDIEAAAERLGVGARDRCALRTAAPDFPGVTDPLAPNFYTLLHELRGHALADMPRPTQVLLSAGCSGRWYFDWLEERYGRVDRHIGAEAFLPMPENLPDNVAWLPQDVSHMPEVRDDTVDLVFSGQNVEHLWPEQVEGFLLESHRVLRHGGWLVIDSPNRELTRSFNWANGEHTVEYTVGEITEILCLTGFDEIVVRGIWLCRDGDRLLPLSPFEAGPPDAMDVLRRAALARNRPEASFVWWAEARKTRAADRDGLRRRLRALFDVAWPERLDRFVSVGAVREEADARWAPVTQPGLIVDGPLFPLPAGVHRLVMHVRGRHGDRAVVRVDLLRGTGDRELTVASTTVSADADGADVAVAVTLSAMTFGLHLRCTSVGSGRGELLLHCVHRAGA